MAGRRGHQHGGGSDGVPRLRLLLPFGCPRVDADQDRKEAQHHASYSLARGTGL